MAALTVLSAASCVDAAIFTLLVVAFNTLSDTSEWPKPGTAWVDIRISQLDFALLDNITTAPEKVIADCYSLMEICAVDITSTCESINARRMLS